MTNLYIVDVDANENYIVEKTLEEFCTEFNDDSGYASSSSSPVYIYITLEEAEEKLAEVNNG